MKHPLKTISLLTASALFSLSSLTAVETRPVGYVTSSNPDGDDLLIGFPVTKQPVFAGSASDVNGSEVTVAEGLPSDLTSSYYVLAKSGSNVGQWSSVVSISATSLTTEDMLLDAGDGFELIEFWTLETLFPEGEGVGVSSNPNSPTAIVLLNDLQAEGVDLSSLASYFYFPGGDPNPPAGWYQTGVFTASDDVVISPETYVTIRNETGAEVSTTVAGVVPDSVVGTKVVRRVNGDQDNQLVNPYPAPMTLADSGLEQVVTPAANPNAPDDILLIFDNSTSGQDISAAASYLYFVNESGSGPSTGWYQTGTFESSDSVELPAGGAFIVRKGLGANEEIQWNPPVPYTLTSN